MAMRSRGPLITLGAVVILAALLLVANTLAGGPASPTSAAATPAGSATSAPPAGSAATPSPTPQPPPAPVQAVFAGVTSGDEATLAVAVSAGQAAAYLCDGANVEAWLQGTVTGDQIALTGRNGAGLTASIAGPAMLGTVTTNTGQVLPFSAAQAAPPAGVYQARGTLNGLATRIGWAVLPDGRQVGLATVDGNKRPAPPLDLATGGFTLDGTASTAGPVAGSDTVVGR
jgi:hypothetical protein